jgi:hypothetical protein
MCSPGVDEEDEEAEEAEEESEMSVEDNRWCSIFLH